MASAKGSVGIILDPDVAAMVKAERDADHRPSIVNAAEALIREAVDARVAARNGHSDSSGRPLAPPTDPSLNPTTESPICQEENSDG